MLLVNLRMDAGYVREGMNINWKGEVNNQSDHLFNLNFHPDKKGIVKQ